MSSQNDNAIAPQTTPKTDRVAKLMVIIAVMLVAILEVMDVSIVNVALPHMMGALNANAEQISWVLTSYIVAAAVIMLLTGFLVNLLGRRQVLIISILGFLVSSCLCGMANSLTQIVIFRTLQGVFGATLVPISQYVLLDSFPKKQQGTAMAIWGIGIMVAPVFGPSLGGIITDELGWRWTFYINVPISLVALAMAWKFIAETPKKYFKIDYLGLILMIAAVAGLQIFLDQGNNYNWFANNGILLLFLFTLFIWSVFLVRGLSIDNHIINFKLFADRNFSLCTIIMTAFISAAMGVVMIQPLMLEQLLNYSPTKAGFVLAPRGITCAISLMLVSRLITMIDMRLIASTGILMCALGSWTLGQTSIIVNESWMIMSASIQGFGMGLVFVPISTLALQTLKPADVPEATGIFNFGRSLGSSIGISVIITFMTRLTQVHWNTLSKHITPINLQVDRWLGHVNMSIDDPEAPTLLGHEMMRQANMLAYIDCYYISLYMFLLVIPLILLTKNISPDDLNQG